MELFLNYTHIIYNDIKLGFFNPLQKYIATTSCQEPFDIILETTTSLGFSILYGLFLIIVSSNTSSHWKQIFKTQKW